MIGTSLPMPFEAIVSTASRRESAGFLALR
jgi:hypothetical protein